jgi:uncharacterized protein (TIGR00369 family)
MNGISLKLPPYAEALAMRIDGLHESAPRLIMPFDNRVQGRPGFLHGGAISGLLEMAAVAALSHALQLANDSATFRQVNVTVDFMRGGTPQDSYASGKIVRMGRTMANVEARAWQDDPDKTMAMAYLHYLLRRG